MQEVRLTPTSYIVLGLLEFAGESTPYGLKQLVAALGRELLDAPARAALHGARAARRTAGYVSEKREAGGRRRRLYAITAKGRAALDDWRSEPTTSLGELREPALLKLFFGADPAAIADRAAPGAPREARRVRGHPRRHAGERAAQARGWRSRPASATSGTSSSSGRSSRARVRRRWPPPQSHGRPSCRSRAAATARR